MKRARALGSRSLSTVLLVGMLAGCGEDETTKPAVPAADVNEYMTALPRWEEFSPALADAESATGETVIEEEIVDGTSFQCETTPYSLTRTPDKIVTLNPDSEILWPGSLLQGKGYAGGLGSLEELPIRQRAPLSLSIDLLSEGNTRTVDSPNLATVNQAIGSLIEAAENAGHAAGSDILFTQERMHSLGQASLKMGISATYMGAEVKSNLEVSFSAEKTNVTAYFIQRMFTVSVVLPQTPGEFFDDSFTEELLQEQIDRGRIGSDNLPVYVSNIVYGRMLMFSLSSSSTEEEIRTTLNVVLESGGEGGGTELSASQRALLEQAEIKVVTVGGDASHALALIRSGNLSDFFATDASLTSARPISYTVRNLADNTIARVSETTEYNIRQCAPENMVPTGAEYRIVLNRISHSDHGSFLCGGQCVTISYYQFWVEDVAGPYTAALFDPSGLGPAFCVNDVWDLVGRPTTTPTVRLHFDGRDEVRIRGNLYNAGLTFLTFNSGYRNVLPTGNRVISKWDDSTGECVKVDLFFTVTKLGDLYD